MNLSEFLKPAIITLLANNTEFPAEHIEATLEWLASVDKTIAACELAMRRERGLMWAAREIGGE